MSDYDSLDVRNGCTREDLEKYAFEHYVEREAAANGALTTLHWFASWYKISETLKTAPSYTSFTDAVDGWIKSGGPSWSPSILEFVYQWEPFSEFRETTFLDPVFMGDLLPRHPVFFRHGDVTLVEENPFEAWLRDVYKKPLPTELEHLHFVTPNQEFLSGITEGDIWHELRRLHENVPAGDLEVAFEEACGLVDNHCWEDVIERMSCIDVPAEHIPGKSDMAEEREAALKELAAGLAQQPSAASAKHAL